MKVCCTCKEEKSLDEFGNNKSTKDGKAYMCKSCKSDKAKKYRNTETGKASKKAWRDVNRDKINEGKRSPRQRELENIRRRTPEFRAASNIIRSTPENKAKRSAYKKSDQGRMTSQQSKHRIRQRFIDSLIEDIKVRDMDIENPYIFYHFEINGVYKFGITRYGVEYRYRDECNIASLKCVHEYILGEREARDIEKIVWNKTRDIGDEGESPFRHTGITELRTEDLTGLVESLINELKIKIIRR